MAKFTDAVEATLKGYLNSGDQPTEAQFHELIAAIQAAIDEHDHAGINPGDGLSIFQGSISKPHQPAFQVKMDGNSAVLVAGDETTLEFDDKIFDTNADFNIATYKYVCHLAGKHLFIATIRLNNVDIDADYYRLRIRTTAGGDFGFLLDPDVFALDPTYWSVEVSAIANMAVDDEAWVTIYQVAGANQTTVTGPGEYTKFMGWFLG